MNALRLIFPIALTALLLMTGCATRYQVRIDALSEREGGVAVSGRTYHLVSDIEEVEESHLFFREVARYVHPALRQAGYGQAGEGASPDLEIGIKAYMSDPLVETRQYSEPLYYDSPGYVSVIRVPVRDKSGNVVRFSYTRYYTHGYSRFGGYVDHNVQYTVYDKILELSARPINEEGEPGGEIWSLKVSLRSRTTDFRSALPYLLVAAEPYIGRRTDGEEIITLREDAEDVKAFRNRLGND